MLMYTRALSQVIATKIKLADNYGTLSETVDQMLLLEDNLLCYTGL